MRQVTLGLTKATVSAISLGTWSYGGSNTIGDRSVGWSGHDDKTAKQGLIRAWELGINHWDTADAYGNGRSEQLIGEAWDTVARKDIFLATKLGWVMGPHAQYPSRSRLPPVPSSFLPPHSGSLFQAHEIRSSQYWRYR